jgi:hypothetical protein
MLDRFEGLPDDEDLIFTQISTDGSFDRIILLQDARVVQRCQDQLDRFPLDEASDHQQARFPEDIGKDAGQPNATSFQNIMDPVFMGSPFFDQFSVGPSEFVEFTDISRGNVGCKDRACDVRPGGT